LAAQVAAKIAGQMAAPLRKNVKKLLIDPYSRFAGGIKRKVQTQPKAADVSGASHHLCHMT
jgi:hypothetical protein